MSNDWIFAAVMVLSAAFVVLASLTLLAAWQSRLAAARPSLFAPDRPATAFLFDGDRLLDATPDARSLLSDLDDNGAWPRVLARLGPMFPGLKQLLETLPRTGQMIIASGPDILLLDEPTSALDPEMTAEVLELIQELAAGGQDIILSTHEMGFARAVADHVALIAAGKILESGPPAQVFENPAEEFTRRFLAKVMRFG